MFIFNIITLKRNMKNITNYYKKLISYTKDNKSIGSINEWIVDNYYLLSEQQLIINEELRSKKILVIKNSRKKELNHLIKLFLEREKYTLNTELLFRYLNNYQTNNNDYFNYDEIDYINSLIKLNIINKLSILVDNLNNQFKDKEYLETQFKKINKLLDNNKLSINKYIKLDKSILNNYSYILEVNLYLTKLGEIGEETFIKLNELIDINGLSLKEIINKEQEERTNENVLMVNLFQSFKVAIKFEIENLYYQLSYSEKLMLNESVGIYSNMNEESKGEYRDKIKSIIRLKKIKEYDFIKSIVDSANKEKLHFGYYLMNYSNYELRARVYILGVIASTLLITYYFSRLIGILSFIILIIPIMGMVIEVINQILMNVVKTKVLYRLKLDNLPESFATMVVIPTILKDIAKLEKMFDNLELFHLSNNSDNLYFTLLGDVTSESKKDVTHDNLIIEAAIKKVDELNKKYGDKFHFIYRNRFYNESEQTFLGYERKRGALKHFNSLLLNKMSLKDQHKYFKYHTFDNFNAKIKYVITLDADTKLLLNTALKLVGTMAHPLNKPILNSEGTKVINGYGIMQPRISIDVEVTSKSDYSQLFAGLGGLDIYATKQFDLYQDIFNEGIFTGKGIYDLEIFHKVLDKALPENLILSHDLLEGNYIRCGYISDVELFDDFPSRYLNDAFRHHRWTRGDWQIISWLKKKVRNEKKEEVHNPINLIGKWKIFDNLRRSLKSLTLLLLIIYGFTLSKVTPDFILLFVISIIAIPIIFYLLTQLLVHYKYDRWLKYYLNLLWGFISVLTKSIIVFAILPYEAYLYTDAIIRSLYRMYISKKNLLNWITMEEVEAISKNTISNYIKAFYVNYITAFILIVLSSLFRPNYVILAWSIASIWYLAPLIMYYVSKDMVHKEQIIDKKNEKYIREIAFRTWSYFDEYLIDEYNYLIPDNYQVNRKDKIDYRTSPTNIGYSLTSVISAYELMFITESEAIEKIMNIIGSVEKLPKWHGHLYNWYNIKELRELPPLFISTADTGNLVATLYVVKGFLEKFNYYKSLQFRVKKLIDNADFSKLYNIDDDVLSIGYSVNDGSLAPYNYSNFLSEARLASFIAIAKKDIPYKHWFKLDRTLTKYKWYKGVVSWTGTMFEYYMPLIFMRSYKHTILDETYAFCFYAQKEFIKTVNRNIPFGITESGYNKLDDAENYKYKAFGIPHLKFKDSLEPEIVVAPYASIMALSKYPSDVYHNIKKFDSLGAMGKYGLYEAYDYEDKAVVKAYYAHHQGMILSSITNYLKHGIIQNYFHSDKNINAIDILLKEKVQVKTYIDLKIAKYKKFNFKRDTIESDIRIQEGIKTLPEVGVLSNGTYSVFINDRGIGFSKYKNLFINRFRKVTNENYGIFVYIKNLNTKEIWTNIYASLKKPSNYNVVFASDRIKYVREDDFIITTTEVMVTKEHYAEIRKIKIENGGDIPVDLEVTSYAELIMARLEEDISHPLFNSMTISSDIDHFTNSLIFTRKSRTKANTHYYVINRFFSDNDNNYFEYETSRMDFIGRNNSTINPNKIVNDEPLSSNKDKLIDPIMSIRKKIHLNAFESTTLYLIIGFGKSREQVLEIVNTYNSKRSIEDAFAMATVLNNTRNRYANISAREIKTYSEMLKYIYQNLAVDDKRKEILSNNILSQTTLWKFGISGDLPIIVVNIDSISNAGLIKDIIQAYEFYKSRALYIDIIFINNDDSNKKDLIDKYINTLMYRVNNLHYFEASPGSVYIIKDVNSEELYLLKTVSRLYFDSKNRKSLYHQVLELDKNIKVNYKFDNHKLLPIIKTKANYFDKDGKEYVMGSNTPMPWSNILSNESFGSLITNNFGGFTYAHNSREFKITSWSNDPVKDPSSETIYINNYKLIPSLVKHGFGYSTFISNTNEFDITTNVFVALEDNIKIYDLLINNKTKNTQTLNIDFTIKPVLGTNEEYTNNNIRCEFVNNNLILENAYSKVFKEKVFITSTEEISNVNLSNVLEKIIGVNISLKEKYRLSFIIGNGNDIDNLTNKYTNHLNIDNEYQKVVDNWHDKLSIIQVDTPDKSFNYMLNGWYLYQVYASRLQSKAALYQVGGATGFRDQLQDIMSILYTNPELAKKQILKHAKHQFMEGDVLHWWHEELMFGSRTKFADDYLWLIYVTYEYIKITGDNKILVEKIEFVDGPSLNNEVEKGINYTYTANKETLSYHLKLMINLVLSRFGEHNLPLMGAGDWNDGMNKVGHMGKGESVWMAFFLYDIFSKVPNLFPSDKDLLEKVFKKKQELIDAIEKAWDSKWYLRAYFDNGNPLGSSKNEQCQIDLISQSWSILTNLADSNKIESMIDSIEKKLVDTKAGIIKLLNPPFENPKDNPGYISDYLPGLRENGAQYTHAAMWYILALLKINEYDKAYEYFQMINPANRIIDTYKVEPYVIAADIYSNRNFYGQGGWTWYTGSASWAYKIAIEEIMGFKKEGSTLFINPKFPSGWEKAILTYKYMDTNYKFEIYKNSSIKIKLVNDKKEHIIMVNNDKI